MLLLVCTESDSKTRDPVETIEHLGPGPFPFSGFVWRDDGKLVDLAMVAVCLCYRLDLAQKRLAFNRGTPLSSSLSLSLSLSLSIYIDIYIIYNIYLVQDRSSSV